MKDKMRDGNETVEFKAREKDGGKGSEKTRRQTDKAC